MPLSAFVEVLEKVLKRNIIMPFELINMDKLRKEYEARYGKPTIEELEKMISNI